MARHDGDRYGKGLLGAKRKAVCLHVEGVGPRFLRFPQSCGGLAPESDIRNNLDLEPMVPNIKRKKTNHRRYKVDRV